MRGWTMGLAIGVLAAPTAKAEPNETLSIRVLAVNQAKVPDGTLREAELHATRIFSALGILLVWTNAKPAEPYYEAAGQVRIVIVPDSRTERDRRRLGTAHSGQMAAYPFYNRIVDLAEHNSADDATLLGHVIAHEMGQLLLPYDSHSSRGVMRAEWDRAQFEDMAKELLRFTPEQAHLIRIRARALRSSIVDGPSSIVDEPANAASQRNSTNPTNPLPATSNRHPVTTIRIVVTNEAAVPQEVLKRAQIQATQIFGRADIALSWKDSVANSTTPPVVVPLIVMIISRPTLGPRDYGMGFAVKGGRLAYVLYPRVADFAERHQIELTTVLGHVLAHELGHLVLPHRPHSSNGIMRGNWDSAHVLAILRSRSGLTFTTEEADLIRRRIETAAP